MEIRILSINGGEKDNAIPTNAEAAVVISQEAEAKDKAFKIMGKIYLQTTFFYTQKNYQSS